MSLQPLRLLLLSCAAAAPAAGFADERPDSPHGAEVAEESPAGDTGLARWLELGGSVALTHTYNYLDHSSTTGTDYGGLSMQRLRLDLQADLELPREWRMRISGYGFYDSSYRINGRSDYTADVLDDYEWDVDFDEVWLEGSLLPDLDVKLGRQIVNWGSSESLRVVDVLNPLDNRDPGLQDLEFLRLPVAMLKLDYYWREWDFTALAIPEPRFSDTPPPGSDFFPAFPLELPPGFVDPLASVPEREPDISAQHTSFAASTRVSLRGSDVSLHLARVWEDRLFLDADATGVTFPDPVLPSAELRHRRIHVAGAAANRAIGSWLAKGEIAVVEGATYTVTGPLSTPVGVVEVPAGSVDKWRLDAMLGVEYYGFRETSISLEVVNRHLFDFERRLRAFGGREDQTELALRIARTFFNDRLDATLLCVVIGEPEPDSGFLRFVVDYDLRDALVLSLGVVAYQGGSLFPYDHVSRNDRLLMRIQYSF